MYHQGYYNSILDIIGNTPMVRLNKITATLPFNVFAKLEFLNPMGSIKDRIAHHLINYAEINQLIKPKETIIENSSGNTALGLALVAIQKDYKVKVIVRDSISQDKLDMLKALNVTVIKVDSNLPPEHENSYNNIITKLANQEINCYFPDQHNNRENNQTHYTTTGPEIWQQMDGQIDILIAGIGTGGTIGGIGKFLKEKKPSIKIIAVDIEGSIFTSYFKTGISDKPKRYMLEGLGDEFIIDCVDFSVIDDMIQISDKDAFIGARSLARQEGILAGGSSGAVISALAKLSKKIPNGANVVIIFPDSAFRYIRTIFNDEWMKANNML